MCLHVLMFGCHTRLRHTFLNHPIFTCTLGFVMRSTLNQRTILDARLTIALTTAVMPPLARVVRAPRERVDTTRIRPTQFSRGWWCGWWRVRTVGGNWASCIQVCV
jgi:hypothetical protein